ncbi:MAG TPA: hypothetical protein VGR55_00915 [Candidatus Acidoferrum sp.]|nr:hypothetical protein [Candidatus Acidoferrum sp.]
MQAPNNLSPQQRSALESVFTTLKGVGAFLQSIESLRQDEKLQAINLSDLADLSQRKLLEAFPELHTWLSEWTRGGVS